MEPERRRFGRHAMRIPCAFRLEGEEHHGFITNLSASGFFLQTTAKLRPGTRVVVVTTEVDALESVTLCGSVVRGLKSHRSTHVVAAHGVGIQLDSAPEPYYQAVMHLHEKP